jgi:hypothetical protein
MIDGLPAFPDEVPEAGWKDLRLGVPEGMVTVRRGTGVINCTVWGNAGEQLQLAWAKVIWACARAGLGTIEGPGSSLTPEEFLRENGFSLPD